MNLHITHVPFPVHITHVPFPVIMKAVRAELITVVVVFITVPVYAQAPAKKIDHQVAALIEQMVSKRTEHQAFTKLEALGCAAVPAIIIRMDDRRNLPDQRMSLQNKSPDAFEGLRHYGPQKVVDAVAAILNQLTGQDFGFIYNGGTDDERAKAVKGWRNFLRKTPTSKLCEGG